MYKLEVAIVDEAYIVCECILVHTALCITLRLCVNLPAEMEETAPFLDSVHVQLSGKGPDVNKVNYIQSNGNLILHMVKNKSVRLGKALKWDKVPIVHSCSYMYNLTTSWMHTIMCKWRFLYFSWNMQLYNWMDWRTLLAR